MKISKGQANEGGAEDDEGESAFSMTGEQDQARETPGKP